MGLPLLLVVIGIVSYLIYAIYMQIKESKERAERITTAEMEFKSAQRKTDVAKADMLQTIAQFYGKECSEKVSHGKIWVGMNVELLIASWGKASEIKKEIRIEKWYYYPYYNSLNRLKYKIEIRIENDQISNWVNLV